MGNYDPTCLVAPPKKNYLKKNLGIEYFFLSKHSKMIQNCYSQIGLNSGLQKLFLATNLLPGKMSRGHAQETMAVPRLVSMGQMRVKRKRRIFY